MGAERGRRCKRSADDVVPPPRDPDRKRVLNVLAQRRYRERKRQRLADLEAKLRSVQSQPSENASAAQVTAETGTGLRTTSIVQGTGTDWTNFLFLKSQPDAQLFAEEECSTLPADLQPTDWSALPAVLFPRSAPDSDQSESTANSTSFISDDSSAIFDNIPLANGNGRTHSGHWQFPSNAVDGQVLSAEESTTPCDHVTSATQNTATSDSENNVHQPNRTAFHPTEVISRRTSGLGFPSSSALRYRNQHTGRLTPGVQNDVSSLDIPVLKIMKAGFFITNMLNCTSHVWDPSFRHVVQNPPAGLPPHFKATAAQQYIPHHPVFDIIPWASARTKLICIFSQPLELRPPTAQDPLAIVNMMMDIDDDTEGMRICGEDGWDSKNWEIGEAFFRNWWWALDRDIVENSNRLRAQRGARRLGL